MIDKQYLSWKNKLGYGSGDIAGNVSSQVKYRNFRQKMQSFSASIFSCNRPVVC